MATPQCRNNVNRYDRRNDIMRLVWEEAKLRPCPVRPFTALIDVDKEHLRDERTGDYKADRYDELAAGV